MAARENIELKTADPDPAATEAACRSIGAEDHGTLVQRDTYFGVADGLLKLREHLDRGDGELIFYRRPRAAALRSSSYWRAPAGDPAALRSLLEAAHGVTGVIEKRRRLFLYENVRIHLDDVRGLGAYVELESVLETPGAESPAEARALATVVEALGLAARPAIAGGYLELSGR
jgi:adenylate cyclase class IV